MRQATLAALALAAAGFVVLAVPHAARGADLDGALLITCGGSSDEGGMTECPVDLVKGRDYDFHARETDGGGLVELVNPVGQTTISFPGPGDGNASVEFHAAYTGTFRIRLRPEDGDVYYGGTVDLFTDCRADAKTQCRLPVGGRAAVVQTGTGDADGLLSFLRKGKVYTYRFPAGIPASLTSPAGVRLAQNHTGVLRVRAKSTGWYLFDVWFGRGFPVDVSLK